MPSRKVRMIAEQEEPLQTRATRLLSVSQPRVDAITYQAPQNLLSNPLALLLLLPFLPFFLLAQFFLQMQRSGSRITTVDLVRDERGRVIQVVSMEKEI